MSEQPTPPCVILDRPQLADNIGSAARVMANFGLTDLRLIAPRDGWPQDRAWATASGADWVLDAARVYPDAAAALADLQIVYAATARPRETRQPVLTPRQAAAELHGASSQGLAIGLLFGGERAGLETADVVRCQGILTIPIDPRHHSLNLAQAVAIAAYEWRTTVLDAPPAKFREGDPPAAAALVEGFIGHLEAELEAGGFFFPVEKKPSMMRNLTGLFTRAQLSEQEVATLRGAVHALAQGRGRALAKLAAARTAKPE
jgi:tRNA/rRNA methyltransferase